MLEEINLVDTGPVPYDTLLLQERIRETATLLQSFSQDPSAESSQGNEDLIHCLEALQAATESTLQIVRPQRWISGTASSACYDKEEQKDSKKLRKEKSKSRIKVIGAHQRKRSNSENTLSAVSKSSSSIVNTGPPSQVPTPLPSKPVIKSTSSSPSLVTLEPLSSYATGYTAPSPAISRENSFSNANALWVAAHRDPKANIPHSTKKGRFMLLLADEKEYLQKLETILKHYVQPLKQHPRFDTLKIPRKEELLLLFHTIENLWKLHTDLHNSLRTIYEHWPNAEPLSALFMQISRDMEYYVDYVVHFHFGMSVLTRLKSLRPFSALLAEYARNDPTDYGGLEILLTFPLNRIRYYEIELHNFAEADNGDLLQHGEAGMAMADEAALASAVALLGQLRERVSATMLHSHEEADLLDLEAKLIDFDGTLIEPTVRRRLVRSGRGQVVHGQLLKDRHFFLFSDMLFCCKSQTSPFRSGTTYAYKGQVPLREARLQDVAVDVFELLKNAFSLSFGSHTIVICVPTREDKLAWMDDIAKLIEELQGSDSHAVTRMSLSPTAATRLGPSRSVTPYDEQKRLLRQTLEAEKYYVKVLRTIVDVYLRPFRSLCRQHADNARLPKEAPQWLFGNIEDLLALHESLLEFLEACHAAWPDAAITPGMVFLDNLPSFRLYIQYATHFAGAMEFLEKSRKSSRQFVSFLKSAEQRDGITGLKLAALLRAPLKRLPEYVLFLENLRRLMGPGPPDGTDGFTENSSAHADDALEQAIDAMAEIMVACTSASSNIARLLEVQSRLSGLGEDLAANPQRVFVREGPLNVVVGFGPTSGPSVAAANGVTASSNVDDTVRTRPRYYFLFSDVLIEAEKRANVPQLKSFLSSFTGPSASNAVSAPSTSATGGASLPKCRFIKLYSLKNAYLAAEEAFYAPTMLTKLTFTLVTDSGPLNFLASNSDDKDHWIADLQAVLRELAVIKVFGAPLAELSARAEETNGQLLPAFLLDAFHIATQRSSTAEAREAFVNISSAPSAELAQLRKSIDDGQDHVAMATQPLAVIAAVLKCWLAELPQPLVPRDLHLRLLEICARVVDGTMRPPPTTSPTVSSGDEDEFAVSTATAAAASSTAWTPLMHDEEAKLAVTLLVSQLPLANQLVLQLFCQLFSALWAHHPDILGDLVAEWGPLLLSSSQNSELLSQSEGEFVQLRHVVLLLVLAVDIIFAHVDRELRARREQRVAAKTSSGSLHDHSANAGGLAVGSPESDGTPSAVRRSVRFRSPSMDKSASSPDTSLEAAAVLRRMALWGQKSTRSIIPAGPVVKEGYLWKLPASRAVDMLGVAIGEDGTVTSTVAPGTAEELLGKRGKLWRKRWVILKDNWLGYFKSPHDLKAKGTLILEQVAIVRLVATQAGDGSSSDKETTQQQQQQQSKYTTVFTLSTTSAKITLQAPTLQEMNDWIDAIESCAVSLLSPQQLSAAAKVK